jgi:RimJ/RimL family protein N-acetyltransferase
VNKKEPHTVHKPEHEKLPILNIMGEKVALGPFHPGLVPLLHRWLNDFEVTSLSGDPIKPKTLEEVQMDYLRDVSGERREYRGFCIYECANMHLIGIAELRRINTEERTATFGILIGEKSCWNHGYGTEATRLLLDYGFNTIGLHNIMLSAASTNERAIKAYTNAGFHLIGYRREVYRQGNRLYDEVLMDCLASEFQSSSPSARNR